MSRRQIREALAGLKPNLVDRVVGYFNPVAGAQRLRSRMFMAVAGGYTGASRARRQTSEWKVTKNSSADADTLPDLQDLRDRGHTHGERRRKVSRGRAANWGRAGTPVSGGSTR